MKLMGIDIGTSGTTALILDEHGNVVSKGKVKYSCTYLDNEKVEQDINILWLQISKAISIALKNLKSSNKTIDAISIASQRGTFIVTDKKGNPVSNAILWSDRRALKETNELITNIGNDNYYKKVGSYPNVLWTASKIMWFEKQNPNTFMYINELEWIASKLGCNNFITSPSVLSQNGMMDIKTFKWNEDVLYNMGISLEQLPIIKHTGTYIGKVSTNASKLTGLKEGTPIYLGGGDQQMASVGTSSIHEKDIHLSLGTGGSLLSTSTNLSGINNNLLSGSYIFKDVYSKEAILLSTGNSYNWLKQLLNATSFKEMDFMVSDTEMGSNGLLFMPFLSGDMDKMSNSRKSGSYLGINSNTSRKDFVRATMEGVANEITLKLSYFDNINKKINVTGDCFKSEIWSKIIANQTQKELSLFQEKEATALGAAITAGVSSEIFESYDDACSLCVKEINRIYPDITISDKSLELFEKFMKCYNFFKIMDF